MERSNAAAVYFWTGSTLVGAGLWVLFGVGAALAGAGVCVITFVIINR